MVQKQFKSANRQTKNLVTEKIRVQGTVQGVGFRPTVYRLAKECGILGSVCNDGQGVLIEAIATLKDFEGCKVNLIGVINHDY